MKRFVLRFKKSAVTVEAMKEIIEKSGKMKLAAAGDKVLLVEAETETIEALQKEISGWSMEPEVIYPRPRTPGINGGPSALSVADHRSYIL